MTDFKLDEDFVDGYKTEPLPFGNISGANSLGEIVYYRSYSRVKDDGTNERWYETVRRVVEGTYREQKIHCLENDRPWDDEKAERSAEKMFDLIFHLKMSPPGRGLFGMGTDYLREERNAALLNNCGGIVAESKEDPTEPYVWLMSMLFYGVGVGARVPYVDGGDGVKLYTPNPGLKSTYTIPDSREGWVNSVRLLLDSYFKPENPEWDFDYSHIRAVGEPIKRFGGIAPGAAPLKDLHDEIRNALNGKDHTTTREVADIVNAIGHCVVSGGVRRSAEILLGEPDDDAFLNLKNKEVFPDREHLMYASNNSIVVDGTKPIDYSKIADRIRDNGEPGLVYMNNINKYGRIGDTDIVKDEAVLVNPCGEQPLHNYELCTLSEIYMTNLESKEEFMQAIKYAYLYAKTVTLIPTHSRETNKVMEKNRRIGLGLTGVADFMVKNGENQLIEWLNAGYEYVTGLDKDYSYWLGVNESIRKTTIKPSGTTSSIAGCSPGANFRKADYHIRRVRVQADHPLVQICSRAGYHVEADIYSSNTMVIEFPVKGENIKTEQDATIIDKAELVALVSRHWSDNAVSNTITYTEDEADQIEYVLEEYKDKWKSVSFLEQDTKAYAQLPYEEITKERYEELTAHILPIDDVALYGSGAGDGEQELFCTTDKCTIDMFASDSSA